MKVAASSGRADAPQPPRPVRTGPSVWLPIALIRLYRFVFSGRPSPCRFDPTCSQYALDAYAAHGFFRGTWMSARRIGRCRPGGGQGYDPVPEPAHRSRQGKSQGKS